jgi:hypothetical protein
MLHSRWTRALAALALLATPFLAGGRALAIQDSEDKVWFGPVGIAPGERALVNIYAIGNPNETGIPDDTPWSFAVRVFDRRGTLVEDQRLQLVPGAIGSVEVLVPAATVPPLGRRTFRAEIVGFNPQPDPPGKWAVTLEVVDRLTGRTSLLLGGPDTLPAAQRLNGSGGND